jgi:hypothetical protein
MSPILGIMASQISGHLWEPQGAYDALATVTLSASTSSVTFAGIPSGYKHLQHYDTQVRFNSDSGSSYPYHLLLGQGSAASAQGYSATTALWGGDAPAGGNLANTFGAGVIDVLDYASVNKNKTLRSLSGFDANGSGLVALASGVWLNSSTAINSITISGPSLNLVQYSQLALYGVK